MTSYYFSLKWLWVSFYRVSVMSRYMPHIAQKLRCLHDIPTEGSPTLWSTILGWFDTASGLSFEDREKQQRFSALDLAAMRKEVCRCGMDVLYDAMKHSIS